MIHFLVVVAILFIPYALALDIVGSMWGSKNWMEFVMVVAIVVVATESWHLTWRATG